MGYRPDRKTIPIDEARAKARKMTQTVLAGVQFE